MKKRLLSLLLALTLVLGLLPTPVYAAEAEVAGLKMKTDLESEYLWSQKSWSSQSLRVEAVAVDSEGNEVTLPEDSKINYQWYRSTDDKMDDSDSKIGTNASYSVSLNSMATAYYYVVAKTTVGEKEYTVNSTMSCVKIGAADITVKFTVNNKGVLAADKNKEVVANKTITVKDLDANGKHSYDEALIALHKAQLSEDGYVTSESSYGGLKVDKLWGIETGNCMFYKNDKALEETVDAATVSRNDALYVSINKDDTYYSDKYTKFNVTSKEITKGQSVELTLTDGDGKALAGIAIGTWKDGKFEALEGKVTDENGKVTLTYPEAGTYLVTAQGSVKDMVTDWSSPDGEKKEADCPLMAPACTIDAKEPGELKFIKELPSKAIELKVGEKAKELSNYAMVYYYIGSTRDTSVKTNIEWYRINKKGNGVAEKVENLNAILTNDDAGQWQYYMYATCEAYGEEYSARSEVIDVNINVAELPKGNDVNEWVNNITTAAVDFKFEKGKTDYTVYAYEGKTTQFNIDAVKGKNLWVNYRVNGIRDMISASYNTTDQEVKVTGFAYRSLPTWFEPGSTNLFSLYVGPKYDSTGDGTINIYDDFIGEYAIYNFTVITLPCLSSISIKDEAGAAVNLTGTTKGFADAYGTSDSSKVKLTAQFSGSKGVKLYVGDSEAYTENLQDVEIDLTQFKDKDGVANIPIKLVAVDADGKEVIYTQTIHLSPTPEDTTGDFDAPVITKQTETEVKVDKGATVKLSVEVEKPEKGTLSYQWVTATSGYNIENGTYSIVEGATSSAYDAPALEALIQNKTNVYYACLVTLTIDGKTVSTLSKPIQVVTNLSKVNPPVISIQPGIAGNKEGGGVYKKTYTAGGVFDPMWLAVKCSLSAGKYVTELGCTPYEVQCFYNSTPSIEGAIELTGKINGGMESTSGFGRYFSFTPDAGLPEGEWYVFFKIVTTSADNEKLTAFTYTDFVKLTYDEIQLGMDGEGTEENPYIIRTAENMVTLQNFVNSGAGNCLGMYFKLAEDVTLPEDWQGIGISFGDGKRFSGVFDGDGHQISFAEESQPLFQYCNMATIKNLKLYGKKIQGGGALIGKCTIHQINGAYVAKIDNVTLVSGSSTLGSGFLRGSASSFNPVYISNSTVEKDVVIGYTKDQDGIGSFAGSTTGSIENCKSAATVYGTNYVGGIAGARSNAMGYCTVSNCSFSGDVIATGTFVGGIFGGGYSSNSAPNAMCVGINNCAVIGNVTGQKNVGGIFGGEGGIMQAWDNGIGRIENNLFYGTITGKENVGGVIGYMASLNIGNVIRNNYYYDTNGCEKAIGAVKYIDTNTHEFGLGEDGTFYFDTSRDSIEDIKEVVDADDKGTSDWQYTSVPTKNRNRTDDPLGKDKDKLGKACTEKEMTDGTVAALLNAGEDSLQNWIQGEKSPILSSEVVMTGLELSGKYETAFEFGTDLDLTGIIITVKYSDGTTKNVDLKEVEITGYNKNKSGSQNITLAYGTVSTELTVTVKPQSSEITVSVKVLGDKLHGEKGGVHGLTMGGLETWAEETNFAAKTNESVWDVLQRVFKLHGIKADADDKNAYNTVYIKGLTYKGVTLNEFDNGANSGWMFTVNGKHADVGVSATYVTQGDEIILHYTDDYTKEENSSSADDETAAKKVDELIEAIGTVELTEECKAKVQAAREAYEALTTAAKAKVTKLNVLEAAELKLAQLEATDADKAAAKKVEDMIAALGTITLKSEKAIQEARAAYNGLSALQKKLVTNYKTLEAAEAALLALKKQNDPKDVYTATGNYIAGLGTPIVASIGGEWAVIGLARSGKTVPAGYYDNVVAYVKEKIDPATQRLHRAKSSDNSRVILALTAIGKDVTNVAGYNLLEGLNDMDYIQKQGINGPIWALSAFDSHNYKTTGNVTREKLVNLLLEKQLADGGWALSGEESDTDITAMTIQALAPYRKDAKVKAALDTAVEKLSKMQNSDGSFSTFSGNGNEKVATSESTSQVIVALSALGIDAGTDSRFIKNGMSAVDALTTYFVKGGGFKHIADGELDGMATEQGYYALTAYYRMLNGQTSLYDMTDVTLGNGGSSVLPGGDKEDGATTPGGNNGSDTTGNGNKTGDDSQVIFWAVIAMATVTAGAALSIRKKREERF